MFLSLFDATFVHQSGCRILMHVNQDLRILQFIGLGHLFQEAYAQLQIGQIHIVQSQIGLALGTGYNGDYQLLHALNLVVVHQISTYGNSLRVLFHGLTKLTLEHVAFTQECIQFHLTVARPFVTRSFQDRQSLGDELFGILRILTVQQILGRFDAHPDDSSFIEVFGIALQFRKPGYRV